MANEIGWGQGVNNDIGWGQGGDNEIGWGSIYEVSWFGETLFEASSSNEFIISVKTDNAGTSASDQFTIPTTGGGYSYDITSSDGHDLTGQTGSVTLTFSSAGTYDVTITGDFPRIFFNGGGDRLKLLEIKQWGSQAWTSMAAAFDKCANVAITATDVPDLSSVTSCEEMFRECDVIQNEDLNSWDVTNVTDMSFMFFRCNNFNCQIESWDMSNVLQLDNFMPITPFDRDISLWDINQVTNLTSFMAGATGLSTANYDALLIAWDAQGAMSYSGTVNFGGSKYTSGGAAETARTSLIAKWGGITDGGAA